MVDVWFGLTPGVFADMCVARARAQYTHLMLSVCSCGPMASCPNPSSIYILAGAFRWRHYQFWPRSTASSQSTSKKTTTSSSPTPPTLFLVPQWAFYCCSRPRYPTTTTKWRSRFWHLHAPWHRQLASPQKQNILSATRNKIHLPLTYVWMCLRRSKIQSTAFARWLCT